MDFQRIEKEARRLQFEIYTHAEILFPLGIPPIEQIFDPAVAARVCGLEYEYRDYIAPTSGNRGEFKAAGQVDRRRGIISVSNEFRYEERRFTGAHEMGHFVLHPNIGIDVPHRDRPPGHSVADSRRPLFEKEADYFAACFIAPARLVRQQFELRFGPAPLELTDDLAFHLGGKQERLLRTAPPGSLDFAVAVAGARSLDGRHFPSLAEHFGLTLSAMAIRLHELDLLVA